MSETWIAWAILIALIVAAFVAVYRITKSQEESEEELARYVADRLKECEEDKEEWRD